jgi:hypothetical protein
MELPNHVPKARGARHELQQAMTEPVTSRFSFYVLMALVGTGAGREYS